MSPMDPDRQRLHDLKNEMIRAAAQVELLADQLRSTVESIRAEHAQDPRDGGP